MGICFVFLFLLHFATKPTSASFSLLRDSPIEYLQVDLPLPSDRLIPSYVLPILNHSFVTTLKSPPFSTPYSPPSDCPSPWSYVVLEFRAECTDEQLDRIAGLWLNGIELLRTSTPKPKSSSGISWKFRKDITKYSSILSQSNITLSMMLQNQVNRRYPGIYRVEVTFLYYYNNTAVGRNDVRVSSIIANHNFVRKFGGDLRGENLGFESEKIGETESSRGVTETEEPADLIIPVSDTGKKGFWFHIESESDMQYKEIQIPKNTHRAVLELYVSYHENDKYWYLHPPNSYVLANNLTGVYANGAYREVFVTIDGELVGCEVPFPVIFSSGINPLFWEPVVAIGAFNLPSYYVELTPFLGILLDGNIHKFGIGVKKALSYWLVDGNLHLWLDKNLETVEAKYMNDLEKPSLEVEAESEFRKLDGKFKTEAERKIKSVGWVKWSMGNFTFTNSQKYKFKNSLEFKNNGNHQRIRQRVNIERKVKIENERGRVVAKTEEEQNYRLKISIDAQGGTLTDTTSVVTAKVSHGFKVKSQDLGKKRKTLENSQDSNGWMIVVDDRVIDGNADTEQSIFSKDKGLRICYSRDVEASSGLLAKDEQDFACNSLSSEY